MNGSRGVCRECGSHLHDNGCMSGTLERIERLSRELRESIAANSDDRFGPVARELCRLMRRATDGLETALVVDAVCSRGAAKGGAE